MVNSGIQQKIESFIFRYLPKEEYYLFVFGSYARGGEDRRSDLDIGIYGENPIDWGQLAQIKDDLTQSDLPMAVEVVDFHDVDDQFKKIALQKTEVWNRPKKNFPFC